MNTTDLRWQQRFSYFEQAFSKLDEAVQKILTDKLSECYNLNDKLLSEIFKEGLIQRFEYTHELAWNVLKDFFEHAGTTNIYGSKDATREAFSQGLIANGDVWMDMIKSRNQTSHTYNQATADAIFQKIVQQYHPAFLQFKQRMEGLVQQGSP